MTELVPIVIDARLINASTPKQAYVCDSLTLRMGPEELHEFNQRLDAFQKEQAWMRSWRDDQNRRTVFEWQEKSP